MQFCLKENIRMMVKKRKTRLCAFSSIFRLQAGVFFQTLKGGVYFAPDSVERSWKPDGFLQPLALSEAKYPPAEWIRLMGPDPKLEGEVHQFAA